MVVFWEFFGGVFGGVVFVGFFCYCASHWYYATEICKEKQSVEFQMHKKDSDLSVLITCQDAGFTTFSISSLSPSTDITTSNLQTFKKKITITGFHYYYLLQYLTKINP